MSANAILLRHAVSVFLAALLATGLDAHARERNIVDTGFVEEAIGRGALVWDVRPERAYLRGHIPGAINIDDVTSVLRDPQTEDYIAIAKIEHMLGNAGIDAAREIVVYGDKARPPVYFAHVTLRYLGVQTAYVFHGGIDDWKDAGKAISTDTVKLPATTFKASLDPGVLIGTAEVVKKIGDASVQIIDARSPDEYSGKDIRALRGGHVPGAVNIPYDTNWVDADTPGKLARSKVSNKDGMNLKPADELAAVYAGLDPDKETIVYCQSGARASETAIVLQDLGFSKVRVYDASWLAYGNTFEAPVEDVSYFNVSQVNNMIRSLQMQVDTLSEEITTLKARLQKQ